MGFFGDSLNCLRHSYSDFLFFINRPHGILRVFWLYSKYIARGEVNSRFILYQLLIIDLTYVYKKINKKSLGHIYALNPRTSKQWKATTVLHLPQCMPMNQKTSVNYTIMTDFMKTAVTISEKDRERKRHNEHRKLETTRKEKC